MAAETPTRASARCAPSAACCRWRRWTSTRASTGVIASIELAQTFVNTTGTPIEATYIFPLPDRAAVHRFRMEVAGRVIEGVVEERGAAREQYDEAIAAGHRAAITEEERAGRVHAARRQPDAGRGRDRAALAGRPAAGRRRRGHVPVPARRRAALHAGRRASAASRPASASPRDTDLVPDASRISPPVLLPGCPNPVRLGMRVALDGSRRRAMSRRACTR